ncbi:hypothetical protein BHM03_00052314 [Ensete ventricosum]|nr:hypothetical protein BHM03_00052314 [Ensete ventricosum]
MHPLRFPNSGIRAKVFVQKIGFKLRVMRLNRIELFYVFMLCFHSEGSEEEGRPATANPHVGPTTHGQVGCGQAPCKWWPPAGAAARKRAISYRLDASSKAAYGQKHRPLPVASPQGAARPRRGHRGSACPRPARRGAMPTEAPAGTVPAARAAADGQGQSPPAQGKRRRRCRRGQREG